MKYLLFILLFVGSNLSAQDFQIIEDEPHYIFLIPSPIANQEETGAEIAQYHHRHYDWQDLEIKTVYLPKQIVAFQIKPFSSHSAARHYYDSFTFDQTDLVSEELTKEFIIISRSNLQKVLHKGDIKPFLKFFKETYF